MASSHRFLTLLLILSLSSASLSSPLTSFSKTKPSLSHSPASPLTPKSSLLRYWARKITSGKPHPPFFVSKLSPLSPAAFASFSSLSAADFAANLASFCLSAHLACNTLDNKTSSASLEAHEGPSAFTVYVDSNFTNYATEGLGATSSFANYSDDANVPIDTFRRYSRGGVGNQDTFTSYSPNGNVVTTNFTSYSTSATGGSGDFSGYQTNSNVPNLKFTNYDTNANGPDRVFSSYTENTNSGDENFAGYGKSGNGVPTTFTRYSDNSNVINSGFNGYGEGGNGPANQFTSYGENGNVPELSFKNYGPNDNGGVDTFKAYRNQSNVGDDTFASYGKKANDEQSSFASYGESFNEGSDNFEKYGEGSFDDQFNFTSYSGELTNFKAYYNAKSGNEFSFKSYVNSSTVPHSDKNIFVSDEKMEKSKMISSASRWVEPGKFFRESNLRKGTVMPMPDIRDKMPPRSFLPRSIAAKIPFSAGDVRQTFKLPEDTAMGKAVGDTVAECERAPSRGETKRCAASAEDMIDFAVSVLGSNVVVRSTENTRGSKGSVVIGEVRGVNGGKVTQSVSCHQSLFPYLVYYCHSVPKVRVYEADILAADGGEKINHGVAICHVDTSDWSAGHGAFAALGSAPGKIEVCHWIFEGDMTWAVAD